MVSMKMKVRMGCGSCSWRGYRTDVITSEALSNPDQIASRKPCPKCGNQVRVLYLLVPQPDEESEA
jgi:ribosomal protein L33